MADCVPYNIKDVVNTNGGDKVQIARAVLRAIY